MEPSAARNANASDLPRNYGEFDALFQASFDIISRYARLLVDSDHDAEVVVIDVYRSAWHGRDRLLTNEAAVSWLMDVTHDCALAYLEQLPRSKATIRHSESSRCAEIRDAIRRLSAKQQQVIVLCYLVGLSIDEASRHLAIKPQAVRALQIHALRHLRLVLDSASSRDDDHEGHDANAAADRAFWQTLIPRLTTHDSTLA
jgi:DNA-directed RNA polymerase specialized sigma24 family protein